MLRQSAVEIDVGAPIGDDPFRKTRAKPVLDFERQGTAMLKFHRVHDIRLDHADNVGCPLDPIGCHRHHLLQRIPGEVTLPRPVAQH